MKIKTKLIFTILATIVLMTSIIAASMLIPANDKAKENARDLALTPPGLEKVVFIHYKKGYGRFCNNNGDCEPELGENPSCADCKKSDNGEEESTCYTFLDKWAKWKELSVSYVINPTNPDELSETFVAEAISTGAEEWDNWTSAELFSDTYEINYDIIYGVQDYVNAITWDDYPTEGVIAVTVIWGYFGGRPSNRRIVEFDVLFDIDFTWGDATIDPTVMDLQNIATHEIGHGAGLGDLYDTVCAEETMYGYSTEGETKKRDLNIGDITGIQKLYF